MSRYLNRLQIQSVRKLGDIIIPGDSHLPRFSATGFDRHIDRMLHYIPSDDRKGLSLLLTIFSFTPKIFIKWLLILSEKNNSFPDFIGAQLRLIQIGLKGLIFTLYYSNLEDENNNGQKILNTIEWDTKIMIDEENMTTKNNEQNNLETIFENAKIAKAQLKLISIKERLNYVGSLKRLILQESESIISMIQEDAQKSRTDALVSEIFGVVDYLHFLEKESIKALKDETVKTPIALLGKKSKIYYEAIGTMLIISPWNYPFYQAIVPIVTSFVAGNATVYKPSEFTPLTGLVESLLERAGFDNNWVQLVYGDGMTGKQLIDQRPDKIFFTGSVATGKKIMQQASQYLIPVELELGGKDPAIIFEDANLDRAVAGVLWGAMTNNGQSCTSVERIYIQDGIYEKFKSHMIESVNRMKQLVDSNGDSDVGYMTTKTQTEIIRRQLEDAISKGAKLHTGKEWDRESLVVPPMVLDNLTEEMLIVKEESFGPFICLNRFTHEHEAIALGNDSEYGLSASVWSADKVRCDRVARNLDVGNVSINNVMLTEGNPYLPFGGRKNSGVGFYKSIYGIKSFTHMKAVIIDSNSSKIEANWYPYTEKRYYLFMSMTQGLFAQTIKGFVRFIISGLKLEHYASKAKRELEVNNTNNG